MGGVIVTILFPILFVSILLDMQGFVENPYFGFLIYMVMGPLFVLGLLMICGILIEGKSMSSAITRPISAPREFDVI